MELVRHAYLARPNPDAEVPAHFEVDPGISLSVVANVAAVHAVSNIDIDSAFAARRSRVARGIHIQNENFRGKLILGVHECHSFSSTVQWLFPILLLASPVT